MFTPDRVETVRERVRRAISDGVPMGELMRLTQLSDGAIYQFTQDGSTVRPYARTLARYEDALAKLSKSSDASGRRGAPPVAHNGGSEPNGRLLASGLAPVEIDPLTFGRILERLELTATMVELQNAQLSAIGRTAHSIGDSLDAAHAMLRNLATGVRSAISYLPPQGQTRTQVVLDPEVVARAERELKAAIAVARGERADDDSAAGGT